MAFPVSSNSLTLNSQREDLSDLSYVTWLEMRGKEPGCFIRVYCEKSLQNLDYRICIWGNLYVGGGCCFSPSFPEKSGKFSKMGTFPVNFFSFHLAIPVKEIGPGTPVGTVP